MRRYPLLASLLFLAVPALAEVPEYQLIIKDHRFEPAELQIPADTKVKLIIHNQDTTPEEFESFDLHREKIIPGNSKAVVFISPVKAGEYTFFGEFNPATAQGKIRAQ